MLAVGVGLSFGSEYDHILDMLGDVRRDESNNPVSFHFFSRSDENSKSVFDRSTKNVLSTC